MPRGNTAFPTAPENTYEYSRAGARARRGQRRRTSRWLVPFLCVFGFAAAAVLSVCALLARADLTVLKDECDKLEESIAQLAAENDHLIIEYETRYNIPSLEAYVSGESGLVRFEQEESEAPVLEDHAEIVAAAGENSDLDKISDVISSVSEYFARPSE